MKQHSRLHRQRGFTLIEALIALVVMAFGMLALASMQASVSYSGDLSKQRTEATRLAQARIEAMRSFTGISSGTTNWDGLDASYSATATTNATYTVTSSMAGADADPLRAAQVTVAWIDRQGTPQSIALSTVLSRTDPKDSGFVLSPLPGNATIKKPLNRSLDIPIRSKSLGNGESSYQISANFAILFSDGSGSVVKVCNPGVANATAAQILASTCTTMTGYVVSGYVTRETNGIDWPTGINHASLTRNTALTAQAIRCDFADALDQNTSTAIANTKAYVCLVPLDTPFIWGGTLRLGGIVTSGGYIVCRFEYTNTTSDSNVRNVQPYSSVAKSLDSQNYMLANPGNSEGGNSSSSLTGGTLGCPSSMTVTGVSRGMVHQDCRDRNPARTTECPAAS
jgi:type IV pilus modification protein PilV